MRPVDIPLFELVKPISRKLIIGDVEEIGLHQKIADAALFRVEVPTGALILTIWHDALHEVTYQTPMLDGFDRLERNQLLFQHYGEGREWIEVLDNGFGKRYRRADDERYSLWSYTMDYNTFGTMEFSHASVADEASP